MRTFGARPGTIGGALRPRIPPNGFAGASQQTAATQATMAGPVVNTGYAMMGSGRRSSKRRRRKAPRPVKRSRKAKSRAPKRRAKLRKGSRAAKLFMARLRAKRKK